MNLINKIEDADEAFQQYKNANSDQNVDDSSADIFKRAHEYIRKHNEEFKQGVHSFEIGHNPFSHIDPDEFSRTHKGLSPNGQSSGGSSDWQDPGADAPSSMDWREKGAVNPIQDQGQCGCCYAFSACASIEGAWFLSKGQLVKCSEQNAMDGSSSGDYGNSGGNGGTMDNVFTYVQKNGGIDSEESYPYTAQYTAGQVNYNPSNSVASLSGFVDIPDEPSLLKAAGTIGPISVGIDASQQSFQLYKTGIYDDPNVSNNPDHAVCVVGYGTENGKDYWLIRNSWGESWGENGYCKLLRNGQGYAAITTMCSYPTV